MTADKKPRSIAATWSRLLVAAAAGVAGLGLAGAFMGFLAPLVGFGLFALGLSLMPTIAVILGVVGLFRTRGGVREGRREALVGLLAGLVLLVVFLVLAVSSGGVPPIHDITTSPQRPPLFEAALREPGNVGRDLSYPQGGTDVTALQLEAYPDLVPIQLPSTPPESFARALAAASEMGLTVLAQDAGRLRFEATATTSIFRFVDDFVVEIEPSLPSGSVVHVRSVSRVGQSDLGANAERIRRFAALLE